MKNFIPPNSPPTMGGHFLKLIVGIGVGLALIIQVLLPALPAHAEDPSDAVVTFIDVQAYRNLGASGDVLYIAHGRWTSGNTSSTPASLAVSLRLKDDTGAIIGATTPYVFSLFENNGYGDIIFSFYLTDNTTWGDANVIEISGLPAYFSDPPTQTYTMTAGDYTTSTSQEDNRAEMTTYILNLTDVFLTIYPDVELKAVTDVGNVLSTYGENYFTTTINGLLTLCPDLFFVQVFVPQEIEVQDYDNTTSDNLSLRMIGSDILTGAGRIGSYIGVNGYVIMGLICFGLCIFVFYKTHKAEWDVAPALGINSLIVTAFAYLFGNLIFTILMIMGLLAIMGTGWVLIGRRA